MPAGVALSAHAAPTPDSGPSTGGTIVTLPAPGSGSFLDVAVGFEHTLALDAGGNLWAWGRNQSGQFGSGQIVAPERPHPAPSTLGTEYTAIAVGDQFSLAIDQAGRLYSWGRNTAGQLGTGTVSSGAPGTEVRQPEHIIPMERFTQVEAGREFGIALDTQGRVWAWGINDLGQAGTGTPGAPVATPQMVASGQVFTQIAAGADHALAIDSDGDVWAWGSNDHGQVGATGAGATVAPQAVTGAVEFVDIAAGAEHSLALDAAGVLWAWGNDALEQLGNGALSSATIPRPTISTVRFTEIQAGAFHSLARNEAGDVWGWGDNNQGQLGQGAAMIPSSGQPTPVPIALPRASMALATGPLALTSVAVLEGAEVWVWGNNSFGQAGIGRSSAALVDPQPIAPPVSFLAVQAALNHTIALDENGTIWGWGANTFGEVGVRFLSSAVPVPAPITEDTRFTAISASTSHNLALDEEGDIWSWGDNSSGQTGTTTPFVPLPGVTPIVLSERFVDVAAGGLHSLALDDTGRIWSWGSDADGALGNGDSLIGTVSTPTPIPQPASTAFTDVETLATSNLALDSDGNIWSWGRDFNGVLGNGPGDAAVTSPQQITTGTRFTAISIGLLHALALDEDGGLWSWGDNFGGELGTGPGAPTIVEQPERVDLDVTFTTVRASYKASHALDTEGRLWGWGRDENQQLGNGPATDTVVRVPTLSEPSLRFTALSGTWDHAAGIGTDGRVYTWGSSADGKLGNGRTAPSDREATPFRVGGASVITGVTFGGVAGTDLERVSEQRVRVTTPPGTPGAARIAMAYTYSGVARPSLDLQTPFRYVEPSVDPDPTPDANPTPDPDPTPDPPTNIDPERPVEPTPTPPSDSPPVASTPPRSDPPRAAEIVDVTADQPTPGTTADDLADDRPGERPRTETEPVEAGRTTNDVTDNTDTGAWAAALLGAASVVLLMVLIAVASVRRRRRSAG